VQVPDLTLKFRPFLTKGRNGLSDLTQFLAASRQRGFEILQFIPRRQESLGNAEFE
jgi:hypothetical protein